MLRRALPIATTLLFACTMPEGSAGQSSSPSRACPRWVVTTGIAALPDVSEDLYLAIPESQPLSDKDRAFVEMVLDQAHAWCTARTYEVQRAYWLMPGPETLYWHGNFELRQGGYATAHAALSRFLRQPASRSDLREDAERRLARADNGTQRIGIVCDGPAELEDVETWSRGGQVFRFPFPLSATARL